MTLPTPTSSVHTTPSPNSLHSALPGADILDVFDLSGSGSESASAPSPLSFLGDPPPLDSATGLDWAGWPDALTNPDGWKWGMDIDTPAPLAYPAIFEPPQQHAHEAYPTATPQELLGLAPLLDAFPFSFAAPAPSAAPASAHQPMTLSPEQEIARMARDAAGLLHAVVATPAMSDHATKLPIPRLPRPPKPQALTRQQPSPASSASGSPPPATPIDPPSKPARVKTSHTTIERRYRTNLNARILALRAAVPATAALDAASGHTPDARGLVDGVKAARKGSKATILGKAVEYITVLKRRETRLRRDVAGLRALVGALVGGPGLLAAWDAQWATRYGTEADDEGAPIPGDEDDDEDDESADDERPRKKAKTTVAPTVAPKKAPPPPDGKRKRGRPKKTAPADAAEPLPVGRTQAPTYVLAVFALASFFNTRTPTVPEHAHTHAGAVLGDGPPVAAAAWGWSWGDALQALHLLASAAVLASILLPLLPRARLALSLRPSSSAPAALRVPTHTHTHDVDDSASEASEGELGASMLSDSSSASDASTIGPAAEPVPEKEHARGLGARAAAAQGVRLALARVGLVRTPAGAGERVAWVRTAESLVLHDDAPRSAVSTAHLALARVLAAGGSPRELAAHALLRADPTLWARARAADGPTPSEKAVLALDVGVARALLSTERDEGDGLLRCAARAWVAQASRASAERRFVRAAAADSNAGAADDEAEAAREKALLAAAHDLGSAHVRADADTAALLRALALLPAGGLPLRQALAAPVFECATGALGVARDAVVDRLCGA